MPCVRCSRVTVSEIRERVGSRDGTASARSRPFSWRLQYAFCFFRARLASAFFQGRSAKPLFGAGPFPIFVLHVLWPPPLMSTCHVFVFLGSAAAW